MQRREKVSESIIYLDANNLYEWAMSQKLSCEQAEPLELQDSHHAKLFENWVRRRKVCAVMGDFVIFQEKFTRRHEGLSSHAGEKASVPEEVCLSSKQVELNTNSHKAQLPSPEIM